MTHAPKQLRPYDLREFRALLDSDPLIADVRRDKYAFDGEATHAEIVTRVAGALMSSDTAEHHREVLELMLDGHLIPAGRIMAGAGTGRAVTLINCFVSETVQDSMPGIQRAIGNAALTMQQGGGIGTDYSTVRPAGAVVKRTGSVASGVLSFADQQNTMCDTIMSAGTRRGAMMMTLRDDHPDLWNERHFETFTDELGRTAHRYPSFITAKRDPWRLRRFNVSVLVSDAFMRAVENDELWDLGFHEPPADFVPIEIYPKPFPYDELDFDNRWRETPGRRKKGELHQWYVYRRVRARAIWEDLMRSTYTYAEPGVVFIDRVNARNNLAYCEDIRCCNPCGEQMLPPHNVCCLGTVNLAGMVLDPFTTDARFDLETYDRAIRAGVRLLDNVLDVTGYPLEEQRAEALAKRRIGLGVTGYADALIQLGITYGSEEANQFTTTIARRLQLKSYDTSIKLARERGSFPLFDAEGLRASRNVGNLTTGMRAEIASGYLRNGVLNTMAPTGTISLAFAGNSGSGIEPVFAFEKSSRKVRQPDGTFETYTSVNYSYRLYEHLFGPTAREDLPPAFVGAMEVSPLDHVHVQAIWQTFVDASISKTINCATDLPYEDFKSVYQAAYLEGCKGCTTYRYDPAAGRGAVLSLDAQTNDGTLRASEGVEEPVLEPDAPTAAPVINTAEVRSRPHRVDGSTYKVKWPPTGDNWYVTVTHDALGAPLELFISTRNNAESQEWVQALSLTITAILRRGGDFRFLLNELRQVTAATGAGFVRVGDVEHPTRYPSVVAAIGAVLDAEARRLTSGASVVERAMMQAITEVVTQDLNDFEPSIEEKIAAVKVFTGVDALASELCKRCGARTLVHEAGCTRCTTCGYEECG